MKKILIVDDNVQSLLVSQKSLQQWLKTNAPYQCIIDIAHEPATVLLTKDVLSYDIIITDWSMPVMDGLTFITALKENGYKNKIILESGADIQEEEYAHLNMDITYFRKPIDPSEINKFIDAVIRRPYISL
ncbi:response regulator [Chitinophaga agrisoli]|uniref:Response regulator n=1 Tax=Chitinophaga agrisoli TaxID=2607653 RepID=A0A5B2VLS1_9BACT|nr:response regulator [Chitinophaga agrisoli]KAA2240513.1 response regulator [Chitinophaga agrisoli]